MDELLVKRGLISEDQLLLISGSANNRSGTAEGEDMKIALTLIVFTLMGIIALMLVMGCANGPDDDDEWNGTVGRGD